MSEATTEQQLNDQREKLANMKKAHAIDTIEREATAKGAYYAPQVSAHLKHNAEVADDGSVRIRGEDGQYRSVADAIDKLFVEAPNLRKEAVLPTPAAEQAKPQPQGPLSAEELSKLSPEEYRRLRQEDPAKLGLMKHRMQKRYGR